MPGSDPLALVASREGITPIGGRDKGGYVYRTAKLVPWYHSNKERCHAEKKYGDQERCTNSASYEGVETSKRYIKLCKTHADMADFPTRQIKAQTMEIK